VPVQLPLPVMLEQLLRRYQGFEALDWPALATLARHARIVRVARGRRIDARLARRGRLLLVEGTVRWYRPRREPLVVASGSSTARVPLLGRRGTDGHVITLSDCTLVWVEPAPVAFLLDGAPVDGYEVAELGGVVAALPKQDWREAFLGAGVARLPPPVLQALFRSLSPVDLAAGEAVFNQGDAADGYFVVAAGRVAVLRDGRLLGRLPAGSGFGEDGLLLGSDRNATVMMASSGRVMRLPTAAFSELLAAHLVRWAAADGKRRAVAVQGDPRRVLPALPAQSALTLRGGTVAERAWWAFLAMRLGLDADAER